MRLTSLVLLVAGPWVLPVRAGDGASLAVLERKVAEAYPDVAHVTPEAVARMLAEARDRVVVFDVREAGEWRVSRLDGALQVSPAFWSSQFLAEYAEKVRGKTVIFYCSVGVRSSRLAGRVQKALRQAGATSIANLSGGIFRWHNERHPLVADGGDTPYVHPYDSYWGRYVARQSLLRDAPVVAPD